MPKVDYEGNVHDIDPSWWGAFEFIETGENHFFKFGSVEYPNKQFQYGYAVYVDKMNNNNFILHKENPDLYSLWKRGGYNGLYTDDLGVFGEAPRCAVVELQYGDVGRSPSRSYSRLLQ